MNDTAKPSRLSFIMLLLPYYLGLTIPGIRVFHYTRGMYALLAAFQLYTGHLLHYSMQLSSSRRQSHSSSEYRLFGERDGLGSVDH